MLDRQNCKRLALLHEKWPELEGLGNSPASLLLATDCIHIEGPKGRHLQRICNFWLNHHAACTSVKKHPANVLPIYQRIYQKKAIFRLESWYVGRPRPPFGPYTMAIAGHLF
jgi:hypothetical protein